MNKITLLSILQAETNSFPKQSKLRDNVLEAMEIAYLTGLYRKE